MFSLKTGKTDRHIFIWRATTSTIQCACRVFLSFLNETKKINYMYQFLNKIIMLLGSLHHLILRRVDGN